MTQRLSRRGFLSTALAAGAFAATSARAEAPLTSLRPVGRGEDLRLRNLKTPEELISASGLHGIVGFSAFNLATGAVVDEHDPEVGMPPASVAKALTASYALDTLGPAHLFTTQVLATGGITNGVVAGDLVLLGGGDPTLDTDGLAELVDQLAQAGVTSVTGRFLVCGSALPFTRTIDVEQPEHLGYSPSVSGLNLNFNRVHFEWKRGGSGYEISMDARSASLRPAVHVASMGVVSRSMPVYTYADSDGRDEWTVASGALGNGGARWLPVRKPEIYAGEVFQAIAAGKGIKLSAPQIVDSAPEGEVVARHDSAPLQTILREMLKYSTNLTAECVGLASTAARDGRPLSLRQSAEAMSNWARTDLGLSHVAMVDHSGLGADSRIAARDMARALLEANRRLGLKPLLKKFPMRDAQRRMVENHPIKVHAKTGTLNFVSGLAGFADLPDGTELVFAIFCGDLDRRDKLTRAEREKPDGASYWNARAKGLQSSLIERWAVLSAS